MRCKVMDNSSQNPAHRRRPSTVGFRHDRYCSVSDRESAQQSQSKRLTDHTFAIPVYRAAPNLATLVESLLAQEGNPSEILLATSTPSAELEAFAKRHALALHINPRRTDIAADWNFALSAAEPHE